MYSDRHQEILQDGSYLLICDLKSGWVSIFKGGGVPIGGNAWDNKLELNPDEASIFVIPNTSAATKSAWRLFATSTPAMDPLVELATATTLCEPERGLRCA